MRASSISRLIAASGFEFLFTVNIMHEIFNITANVSQSYQEVEFDVIDAQDLIESTLKTLEDLQDNGKFKKIFQECEQFAMF